MDLELFTLSDAVAGTIGIVSAFAVPFLYGLLRKIFKRDITKEEKRQVTTYIAIATAVGLIVSQYDFTGFNVDKALDLALELVEHFAIVKGLVEAVYQAIIKGFKPTGVAFIDTWLTKFAGN